MPTYRSATKATEQPNPICLFFELGEDEAVTDPGSFMRRAYLMNEVYRSVFWEMHSRFEMAHRQLRSAVTHSQIASFDESPSETALDVSDKILRVLETHRLPPTRVNPSAQGGIAMIFIEGSKRSVVEIYNNGEIAAVLYDDSPREPVAWDLTYTNPEILEAIKRIRVHLAS